MTEQEIEVEKPSVRKVQYNIEGATPNGSGFDGVETEYKDNINHDGKAFRIVLENDIWMEYREDGSEVIEALFIPDDHDTVYDKNFVTYYVNEHEDLEGAVSEILMYYGSTDIEQMKQGWSTLYGMM